MPTAAEALNAATPPGPGGGAPGGPGGGGGAPGGTTTQVPPGPGGSGGGGEPFWSTWVDKADTDTRTWLGSKNYPDPKTALTSFRNMEREASTLRGAKPGYPADTIAADGKVVKADAQARAAWNLSMGVPDSPEKYDLPVPAENPYPQFKSFMAKAFHDIGVPPAMATAIAKGYESSVQQMEAVLRTEENQKSTIAMAELERAWGSNFQERTSLAARGKQWLANEVGGLNEIQMRTLEATLGTDKFMTAMWKIGAGNKEGGFAGGDNNRPGFGNSASEAQSRLDELQRQRTENKLSDFQWRELDKPGGELEQLRDRIVQGMAPTVQ